MARGPVIKQDEVNKAHAMKAEGKKPKEIALTLERSIPTVVKMLLMQPQQQG